MRIQENVSLAAFSNFSIGGPARFFIDVETPDECCEALAFARQTSLPLLLLGGGTNILFRDEGFAGVVIRSRIRFIEREGTTLHAGAGASMKEVLQFAAARGLAGLEWAGGLPGTIGGAVWGNAGAFGGQMQDSVASVSYVSSTGGDMRTRTSSECAFGYRMSVFKYEEPHSAILAVSLALHEGIPDEIKRVGEEKIRYRKERHPIDYPNIGSIFKNVPVERLPESVRERFQALIKQDPFPVLPTAVLIADAGFKGVVSGGAMISPKHPNFIVNAQHARAEDVRALMSLVQRRVRELFSVQLEEEVIVL